MQNTRFFNSILLLSNLGLAFSAFAQTNATGASIHYINPSQYAFGMSPVAAMPTDCTQLNRLLGNYSANHCDTATPSAYCQSILAQIKVEQTLDRQDTNPLDDFERLYRVGSTGNVATPSTYSKRFDISYADSFNFPLSSLEIPNAFRFEGGMTSAELSVEAKLGSPQGFHIVVLQSERYLQLKSKIRVCALENARISLVGKANMNISGYHPLGNVAYDIVDSTYRKAVAISARTDVNDSQKNYLLGIVAGDALKQISNLLSGASEIDDVSLSLQTVIMDTTNPRFAPFAQTIDSGLSVRLIDPGFVVPNAPIQINYQVQP